MFLGVYWNQPVRLPIHVSVPNTSFCQHAGGGIVMYCMNWFGSERSVNCYENDL